MKSIIHGIRKSGCRGFACNALQENQTGTVHSITFTLKDGTKHQVLGMDSVIWESHQITEEAKSGFSTMAAIVESLGRQAASVETSVSATEVTREQIEEAKAAAKAARKGAVAPQEI